jgi:hypothetical protein
MARWITLRLVQSSYSNIQIYLGHWIWLRYMFNRSKAQIHSCINFLNSWWISPTNGSLRLMSVSIIVQRRSSQLLTLRCFKICAGWRSRRAKLFFSDQVNALVSSRCVKSLWSIWSRIHMAVEAMQWYRIEVYQLKLVPNWILYQIRSNWSKFLTIVSLISIVLTCYYDSKWTEGLSYTSNGAEPPRYLLIYSTDWFLF